MLIVRGLRPAEYGSCLTLGKKRGGRHIAYQQGWRLATLGATRPCGQTSFPLRCEFANPRTLYASEAIYMRTILALTLLTLFSTHQTTFAGRPVLAKQAASETYLRVSSTALGGFAQDVGRFPSTAEGLDALVQRPSSVSPEAWKGPYLSMTHIPLDPWGHPWVYQCPGNHTPYPFDLYTLGADGISVTSGDDRDDINNWNPQRPWGSYYRRRSVLKRWTRGPLRIALVLAGVVALVLGVWALWRPSRSSDVTGV